MSFSKLKEERKKKQMSQFELADIVSTTQGTIHQLETGQIKEPNVYLVLKIAMVFKRDATYFLDADKLKIELI